ncbi:T9SS type A sorting domain-containing protein [Kordia sp.]|uniref:T9SS type A sorting domain-containing protein n=1 Tax=Kordia sp. TaxID=1965332 RepID=UPI003D2B44C3
MRYFLLLILLVTVRIGYSQNIALDPSFGDDGYTSFTIQSVNDLSDTVLLPTGEFITSYVNVTSVGWTLRFKKIDANGVIDTSYNGGISTDGAIEFKKLVYHNNHLYFIGSYSTYPYNNRNLMIVRFDLNGAIDTTFGTNGQTLFSYGSSHDDALDFVIDNSGNSYIYAKHSSDYYVVKLNTTGTIDTNFGSGGAVYLHSYNIYDSNTNKILNKMFLQNDGKFILVGAKINPSTDLKESFLTRKLQDGSADLSFGTNGELIMSNTEYSTIKDLKFEYADNSILLLHQYDNSNQVRDRIFLSQIQISNGALNTAFANNGMTSQYSFTNAPNLNLQHITVLSDSKMLVVGSVSNFSASPSINTQLFVMRFNSDGSLDYTSSSSGYHIFDTTPPDSSMRADHVNRLFDMNNGTFIIAYSGYSATHGAHSYLARFNGATLGLDDFNEDLFTVAVSPNPSRDYVTIQHSLHTFTNFNYEIVDLIGRITQRGNSKFNEKINIGNLPSGTYIFRLQTELGEKFSKKIIIE